MVSRILSVVGAVLLVSCAASTNPSPLSAGGSDLTTPDGVRLRYRVAGRGQPVLMLLHGGPGSNYNAVWPDLEPLGRDFTVVMYDQRGGGRSEIIRDSARLSAADHVQDLEALREHLKLDRLTLLGESWGSALALLYAAEYPDRVDRILFLGPMPPTRAMMKRRFDQVNDQTGFYQRLANLRTQMPSTPDPIGLCREMFAEYLKAYFFDETAMARRRGSSCDAPAEGVRNYPGVNDATLASLGDWDFLPLLRKIRVPTMVVEGAGSTPTLESVQAWAAALPDTKLVLIPDAGHFPQVEQPALVFPVIRDFLMGRKLRRSALR